MTQPETRPTGTSSLAAAATKSRLLQLDILRGVAILLVLGHHPVLSPRRAGHLQSVAELWQRFGWTGVDLFFVLSGFLIGGLLFAELRTKSVLDVRRFVIRRGLRIWPPYLFYVGFVTILLLLQAGVFSGGVDLVGAGPVLRSMLPNYLHAQNYLGTPRIHTWSLAVEEHFYLALSLLLVALTRGQRVRWLSVHAVPAVAGLLAVGCTTARYFADAGHPTLGSVYSSHLRADSLFFGVLLAYLHNFRPALLETIARRRAWLLTAGLALVSPMLIWDQTQSPALLHSLGFTGLYIGYGCILIAFAFAPLRKGTVGRLCVSPFGRAVAVVGFNSYAMYLWHADLGEGLRVLVLQYGLLPFGNATRWILSTGTYVALLLATAVLTGRLIDKPTLALRDRLFPARAALRSTTTDGTPAAPASEP